MKKLKTIIYIGPPEGFEEVRLVAEEKFSVSHVEATKKELEKELRECDALIDASMGVFVSDEMISGATNLEIISTASTGSDHIEQNELVRRGIELRTLREDSEFLKNITPAAELSWSLLMAAARNLLGATNHVRQGHWVREAFPGIMLRGKRLGVIGCGRIGQWMARYAQAFGMEVCGHDPFIDPWPKNIRKVELEELGRLSDFISIHVHLSEDTFHLVDDKFLQDIKSTAIIVNTSRGAIVDEGAVLKQLQAGALAGYAADVLVGEPDVRNHPLVRYAKTNDNVIITPHCGGFSHDAVRLVCRHATSKVIDHFDRVEHEY